MRGIADIVDVARSRLDDCAAPIEAEQHAAAEIYKKNKDATNADLPPPG